MKIRRYHKIQDCPDRTTCDICYVDRLTGQEVMRYDGADPANTHASYGAIPDTECFHRKGLDIDERIDEDVAVKEESYISRYTMPWETPFENDEWDDEYDPD